MNGALSKVPTPKARGYSAVGLINPKNPFNVGSALRAAGCYEAQLIVCAGGRNKYRPMSTDTMKTYRRIPLQLVSDVWEVIPYDCVPVAVDLISGATPLHEYKHPERAFYLFGPEDGTLGKAILERCRDVVYVPTTGPMNLAATVNVILYDRQAKQMRGKSVGSERGQAEPMQ